MKISRSRLIRLINETLAEGNPYEPEEMYPYEGPQSAQSAYHEEFPEEKVSLEKSEYFTGEEDPEEMKAQGLDALAAATSDLMDLGVSEEEIITAVLSVTNEYFPGER